MLLPPVVILVLAVLSNLAFLLVSPVWIVLSSVIGSGWLFAAYNAAKVAGPAALLASAIAGVATLLVFLVFIDLSIRAPLSGGNVR